MDYTAFKPDSDNPTPLYYQIEKFLRSNIDNGSIAVGDMLPPETELTEIFGVSRSTVRQAIAELVSSDVLTRRKGKGTFVKPPKIEGQSLQVLTSFDDEIRAKGRAPKTRVLELSVGKAPEKICEALGCGVDCETIYLRRLRYVDGEPILYFETYLPHEKYKGLENIDFERNSLYATLEKDYSVRVDRVIRRVEVANATREEAELLGIKRGDAIFLVTFTGFHGTDPVEYSITRYRGDKNEFVVEIKR